MKLTHQDLMISRKPTFALLSLVIPSTAMIIVSHPASEVILVGSSEVIGPQYINLRAQSAPRGSLDRFRPSIASDPPFKIGLDVGF